MPDHVDVQVQAAEHFGGDATKGSEACHPVRENGLIRVGGNLPAVLLGRPPLVRGVYD